jgi:hypothetical protein
MIKTGQYQETNERGRQLRRPYLSRTMRASCAFSHAFSRSRESNAALVSYYQSSAFGYGLAPSSQQMRRNILERFRDEHGDKRIGLLHKKALQAILNSKSPAAASNWRKALRGFIDHAMSLDMLTVDPLAGIKLVPIKSDGHHPWEADECAQFEAHHAIGTRARLAYELLLQVGHPSIHIDEGVAESTAKDRTAGKVGLYPAAKGRELGFELC